MRLPDRATGTYAVKNPHYLPASNALDRTTERRSQPGLLWAVIVYALATYGAAELLWRALGFLT